MKDHKSDSLRAKAEKKIEHLTDVKLNDISADDARQLAHDLQVHQIELEMQNEELRRTQSELEQSRSKYSDLYDFAPVGYFTFDKTGLILEVNLTGAEQLGMERRSLIKKPFSGFIHKDDQDLFYLHRQQVLKSKSRQNIEIRVKRVEGAEFHAHLECLPVLDKEGNVTLMRTAISDITDHIRVELLLALAREEWERTFDAIPDIVMVTDPHHRITKANIALARKLGVKREDLIGQFCYNVIHGTDKPPSYCPHVITLTNGTENIAEIFEDTLKDHFILSSSPIRDSEGNITGAIEIFRNISSLKKMEEQLRAASLTDALTGLFNRRGFFTLA